MRRDLDGIWLAAAARLGVPVVRGTRADDPYVHWDGVRLHLAADEFLDDDDTVAQLILHELCHWLVQGTESRRLADWGLDNTTNADEDNERAAVRLQAHLLGAHGLRDVLFPTTVVRAFYESLSADALAPVPVSICQVGGSDPIRDAIRDAAMCQVGGSDPIRAIRDDASVRLARLAAVRCAQSPTRNALQDALEATAAAVGRPLHPKSGFPLLATGDTCGNCAARTPTGLCRQSERRVFVGESDPACTRFEASLDCLTCGACCRSAYDMVPVRARDLVVKRHPSLVFARDPKQLALRREGDRCAALSGPAGGPFACVIYDDRPRTCSDFERGGRHCFDARRRVGLSF